MTWEQIMPGAFKGTPGQDDQEELERLVKLSNIPRETARTHRLETWQHKHNEDWWDSVEQYVNGNYTHPFLSLLGIIGTGKTHIALSIAWEWLRQGKTVVYYQVEGLLDALRHGYSSWRRGNPDGYQSVLAFSQNASLLILDDFGAQQETEWATSKLDQIVDHRYINRKPLIVTTNLALDKLPPRIVDRLREGALIQLSGTSYRGKKHEAASK